MNKKSTTALETLLILGSYLILAVAIFLIIASIIPSEKSFFKDYFVRDVGLTINSFYNFPGNFKIKYHEINDVDIEIQEGIITLKSSGEISPKIYHYIQDKNYDEIKGGLSFDKNSTLIIKKDYNRVELKYE